MWLITDFGFFSVVRKPGESQLTVRARTRTDLETLRERHLPALGEILEGAGTDYQFRARVPVEDLAEAMQGIVQEIDYPNFKNAVTRNQGPKRARIYHEVWQTLWQINQED